MHDVAEGGRVGFRERNSECRCFLLLAERVGFEPTIPVKVCPLSRRIVSTTHAPLRAITRASGSAEACHDYTFQLYTLIRRLRKNSCKRLPHSSASTPGTTSI